MMSAKPKGTELMAWEPKMKMWAAFMQALVQFITQTPQILSVKIFFFFKCKDLKSMLPWRLKIIF